MKDTVYLCPKVRSGYGEDTFWVWFENNFSNYSYKIPENFTQNEVVLRYSTVGPINASPAKTVALCWELLPEMRRVLKSSQWDNTINLTYKTAEAADIITVASRFSVPYYEKFGKVKLLPIGVDTELFRPYTEDEKYKVKLKHNIPLDKEIGFWCGTTHKMKGFQNLQKYAAENPDIYWIIVWYQSKGVFTGQGQQHFIINQSKLVELMNCADFQLSTSILRPYYIIEYEGMSCNLKQRRTVDIEKDFEIGSNPRDQIFENKWDRLTCKKLWKEFIDGM